MTPEQKRAASAKEIKRAMPDDPKNKGPVVLSNAAAKRAVARLEPQQTDLTRSVDIARKL